MPDRSSSNPQKRSQLAARLTGRRALVTGLTGQDGYYLARYLLSHGCHVTGLLHEATGHHPDPPHDLQPIDLARGDLTDPQSIDSVIQSHQPDIIYHLAAQSSVGLSWEDPARTAQVNALGTIHLLDAVRSHTPNAAFVFAGSCDCYDHEAAARSGAGVTPDTPFMATNPYAASKIMAHQLTRCYRERWGLNASVAVLFNHTSPRRSVRFVERGVVHNAVRVALGLQDKVTVGSLATRRDWSWAEDLMEAFALLGALTEPADLVLASGQARTVGDWVREAFAQLGLDPARHCEEDPSQLHPGDRPNTYGNLELARQKLGWTPKVDFPEIVRRLIAHDRAQLTINQ